MPAVNPGSERTLVVTDPSGIRRVYDNSGTLVSNTFTPDGFASLNSPTPNGGNDNN